MTPELAELIKRTFRGVHLLAFLRREELDESGRKDLFRRAAADARAAQDKTLGADEPNAATRDTPPRTGFGVADARPNLASSNPLTCTAVEGPGTHPEYTPDRLVKARHAAINSLSSAAQDHGVCHVVIAGDLFDTEPPSDRVWRPTLSAMAAADNIDWWIIPGDHDRGAAEALWDPIRAQLQGSASDGRSMRTGHGN